MSSLSTLNAVDVAVESIKVRLRSICARICAVRNMIYCVIRGHLHGVQSQSTVK